MPSICLSSQQDLPMPVTKICLCLQGLSVTELEAQMLARGVFGQQPQAMAHQQAGLPQPGHRPPQIAYSQGSSSSGLYSPSAAAALARLTQSAQQGHQAQPSLASSSNLQRLSPLLQSSLLANQTQQRQGHTCGPPGFAGRPGQHQTHLPLLTELTPPLHALHDGCIVSRCI